MEEKITSFPKIEIGATQTNTISFWSLSTLTIVSTFIKILLVSGELVGMVMILYGGIWGLYSKYVKKDIARSKKLFKVAIKGVLIVLLVLIVWFVLTYINSISQLRPCIPGKTCP